ncbi:MAG: hypothetical protein F6K03_06150 [Kamptonema sp. SIO4C4]|nr:hypothetical protein [Kamptonema sp. SIO4C4]
MAGGILGTNVTLNNSTVSGNSAFAQTGGIAGINVTLNNSTVSGNSVEFVGGGVLSIDDVTLNNSTVSGNYAGFVGGGVYSQNGVVNLNNSTVSGNSTKGNGGGIRAQGGTILNSTIAYNVADMENDGTGDGGGIYRPGTMGTFTIQNSIVAQNSDRSGEANDLGGTFDTIEYSLIQDTSGATINNSSNNIIGQDPQLLPLGDYGGPTQTHALKLTSPALNAGNNALAGSLTTDPRGAPGQRIAEGTVDIGAFEWQGAEIIPIGEQNQTITSFPSTLDVSVRLAERVFDNPAVGINVGFSTSGTVTGSFTNGTTVLTNANGVAANFFAATSGTENFQILTAVMGADPLTFNITIDLPAAPTPPNFTSIWESILDELHKGALVGSACQTVPEINLEPDDDGEDAEAEQEIQYDRNCRPVSSQSEE